jgi:hypothetical protein
MTTHFQFGLRTSLNLLVVVAGTISRHKYIMALELISSPEHRQELLTSDLMWSDVFIDCIKALSMINIPNLSGKVFTMEIFLQETNIASKRSIVDRRLSRLLGRDLAVFPACHNNSFVLFVVNISAPSPNERVMYVVHPEPRGSSDTLMELYEGMRTNIQK